MADRRKQPQRRTKKKKDDDEAKAPEPEPELPDGPKIYVVGGEWSTLRTINEAISKCKDGDEIVIKPGIYNEEVVLNKDALQVRGQGSLEEITIRGGVIATSTGSSLQGITIHSGIQVQRGNLSVKNCAFANAKHNIRIYAVANPSFSKCNLSNSSVAGVYCFPDSRGSVESCTITGNGGAGTVGIYADSCSTTFKRNTITKHVTGVLCRNGCDTMVLSSNVIQDISGTGVHVTATAKPTIRGNTIAACKHYGVVVEQSSAPVLEKNQINASTVLVKSGCSPVVKGNTVTGRLINENETSNPAYGVTY